MSYNFISENLLVGDYTTAQNLKLLQETLGVTHIVSCGFDKGHFPRNFCYFFIPILDTPNSNLLSYLPRVVKFIQNALDDGNDHDDDDDKSPRRGGHNTRVYVHCVHGQSRSCAVCIAYLIHRHFMQQKQHQDNKDEKGLLSCCYNTVQSLRPCMAVNPGFVQQLEIFRQMKVFNHHKNQEQWVSFDTVPTCYSSSRAHATFRLFKARLEFYNSGRVVTFGRLAMMKCCDSSSGSERGDISSSYTCRKCRNLLFTFLNVILGGRGGGGGSCRRDFGENLPMSEYWRDSVGGKEYAITMAASQNGNNHHRNETIDRILQNNEEKL